MVGIFKGDHVVVEDEKEANQIYNKGFFGQPQSGGGLELDLYEAVYLLEADRLDIESEVGEAIDKEDIMEEAPEEKFVHEYPSYKDMRSRGYVLKKASNPASFRVFPRGGGPNKTPTKYWLCTHQEKDVFKIQEVLESERKISNLGKTMLTALVDEEGDVTYYKFSTIDLKGAVEEYGEKKLKGTLYGDKCIIEDGFAELHDQNFYGFEDNDNLRLSFYESLYLKEKGILEIEDLNTGKKLSSDDLISIYPKDLEEFQLKYDVYTDLRDKGLIPKTGFKYGAPFRAYAQHPDEIHAEYIVQPLDENHECRWYEISRAVRVAHSVRKKIIFARVKNEKVDYLKVKRETP